MSFPQLSQNIHNSTPTLSVVVLCYREGQRARDFAAQLEDVFGKTGITYELVLVGNYWDDTNDATPRVVQGLARQNPRITAVALPKQAGQGMGWDARKGMEATRGDTIALIDGDGQIAPEDILAAYQKLCSEQLDLCKAVRVAREDGFGRKIITMFYNAFVRILFPDVDAQDMNGKPKLFTRHAYGQMKLESNGWFLDGEIMIRAKELGLRCRTVPVVFRKNLHRSSHVRPRMIFDFIKDILEYRISH